jgi:MOSC domain-containing protein YiiM
LDVAVYVAAEELEAVLAHIQGSPTSEGTVELVARRPAEGEREVLEEASLDVDFGLVGDDWHARTILRGQRHDPRIQLTLMNSRTIALLAGDRARWALAGDQLYVDLDLSNENLPPGARLEVGTAVIEISDVPHTGCAKFTARFGSEATRFVNGRAGRPLRLRGVNARVVTNGVVRPGDSIRKL